MSFSFNWRGLRGEVVVGAIDALGQTASQERLLQPEEMRLIHGVLLAILMFVMILFLIGIMAQIFFSLWEEEKDLKRISEKHVCAAFFDAGEKKKSPWQSKK